MSEQIKNDVNVEETAFETFEFVDNHGRKYNVPKVVKHGEDEIPIQVILGNAIAKSRKDTQTKLENKYSEYITELNTIKNEYENTKSKLEEFEISGLSEKDKELQQLKKQLERYDIEKKNQEEQAKNNFERFKNEKIKSEIYSSLNGFDLYNTDQTAKLFMSDVNIDFIEEDGNYSTKIKAVLPNDKGEFVDIEGSPKDIFGKWIGLQSNSYLLKNTLNPGGGTSKTGATRTGSGVLKYKRSDLRDSAQMRKEYAEKRKLGLDVSIVEG